MLSEVELFLQGALAIAGGIEETHSRDRRDAGALWLLAHSYVVMPGRLAGKRTADLPALLSRMGGRAMPEYIAGTRTHPK